MLLLIYIPWPGFSPITADGSELKGKRLTVNFVRGPKRKDDFRPEDRQVSHPQNGPKGEKEGKVD